jgi:hypothetical protein
MRGSRGYRGDYITIPDVPGSVQAVNRDFLRSQEIDRLNAAFRNVDGVDAFSIHIEFTRHGSRASAVLPVLPVPTAAWGITVVSVVFLLGIVGAWLVMTQRTARRQTGPKCVLEPRKRGMGRPTCSRRSRSDRGD